MIRNPSRTEKDMVKIQSLLLPTCLSHQRQFQLAGFDIQKLFPCILLVRISLCFWRATPKEWFSTQACSFLCVPSFTLAHIVGPLRSQYLQSIQLYGWSQLQLSPLSGHLTSRLLLLLILLEETCPYSHHTMSCGIDKSGGLQVYTTGTVLASSGFWDRRGCSLSSSSKSFTSLPHPACMLET